jgi:hypothetical protein
MELIERVAAGEVVYRRVIADLRSLGHEEIADEIEHEAVLIYGNPDASEPAGILRFPVIAIIPWSLPTDEDRPEPFVPPAYPGVLDP